MIARFKKSKYEPKPIETDYWVDLLENEYGGVFKYYDYNAKVWKLTLSITTEKEPKFTNSAAFNITNTDIASWNSKLEGSDLDTFKQEVYYMISTTGGISQETFDFELGLIRKELDTKAALANTLAGYGINNAYTKTQIDDKLKNLEIELPTNVSYFVNDAKYVTEDTFLSKLPEDIVSDSNYVHTDNNFTSTLKLKLDNIDLEPINNSIDAITSKVNINESDILTVKQSNSNILYSVNELTNTVNSKPDFEDVYTREYLDNIFTTFIRKTHRSYGFLDERPNDLEVTDTGFIFYDYSVNEPLIWVADRWRTLISNEPIGWYLLDRDLTLDIGNWEFVKYNNDLCILTKYLPAENTSIDLSLQDVYVPNTYVNMFTLGIGENTDNTVDYVTKSVPDYSTSNFYDAVGNLIQYKIEVYVPDKYRDKYIEEILPEGNDKVSYKNIFGKYSLDNSYNNTYRVNTYSINQDETLASIRSITLSKGIKSINKAAFANTLLTDTTVSIPSGIFEIGEGAFMNDGLTSVTFPNNPYRIKHRAFAMNNILEVTFPSTMDYDYILNGGGWDIFAQNTPENGMIVNIPNGTKAIPRQAFYNTIVSNPLTIPNSLIYIGSNAFYNSEVSGSFDSNNLEKLGSFAFRNNKFSSIVIGDKMVYLGNYCLHTKYDSRDYSKASSVNQLTLGKNIEIISRGAFYMFNACSSSIVIPDKVEMIGSYAFYRYHYILSGFNNYGTAYTGYSPTAKDDMLEYINSGICTLTLNQGLKYIGSSTFINSCFSGELILPESLKAIGDYAFDWATMFNNTKIYIPKNLQYIGGLPVPNWWRVAYRPEFLPNSPSGYSADNIKLYIEDGGKIENKSTFALYIVAGLTLKEFEVDPENQWFKAVDGMLLSKDGSRLVAVPTLKNGPTLVIPEGVTSIDYASLSRNGFRTNYEHKNSDGTFTSKPVVGSYLEDHYLLCNGILETPINEILLPNSLKIRTPRELLRDFPCTCVPDCNELIGMTYYCTIDRYKVKDDNPYYKNDGDWLLSKDGTELVALASGLKGDIYIPDSVTTILPGFTPLANYFNTSYNRAILLVDIDEIIEQTTPYASTGAFASMYKGIYLHIGPNVVNVSDYVLRELSSMNLTTGMAVYIDEDNPAITINSKGWVVRKEAA